MVHLGFANVGHMFSKGFSVIDVRNPAQPKAVRYVPAARNTWNIHLQTQDDLLLVINAKDMFAAPEFQDERAYYKGELGRKVGTANAGRTVRDWRAGLAVYDISRGEAPREIGFMPIEGGGIHRLWYVGGRWAYASALIDGIHRLHFHHDRYGRSHSTARGGAILVARNECRGGRAFSGQFVAQAGPASPHCS